MGSLKVGDRSLNPDVRARRHSSARLQTEALSHQALHDGLTGLANRTLFTEHVAAGARVRHPQRTSRGRSW